MHVEQTFTELVQMQQVQIESSPKEFEAGQIAFLQALFSKLKESDVLDVLRAYYSKVPVAIDPSQLDDPKTVALLVLWVLSGEQCSLGLPTSDVSRFTRTLNGALESLEGSPIAIAIALSQPSSSQDMSTLKQIMSDQSISLKHRLELCKYVSDPTKRTELYRHLARLTSSQNRLKEEFEWSSEQIDAFKALPTSNARGEQLAQLDPGQHLALAIAYKQEKRIRLFDLATAIGQSFHIKTHRVLAEEIKAMSKEKLAEQRLLVSLKDPESQTNLKQCKGLILLSDFSSSASQAKLLEFLDFGRITLRMKGVISELIRPNGCKKSRYLELLGWSLLAKRVIALSWMSGTNQNLSQKVDELNIGYRVSSQKTFQETQEQIQNKMLELLVQNKAADRKLKAISRGYLDQLYVVSSKTHQLHDYIERVSTVLKSNGFEVKVIDGYCTKAQRVLKNNPTGTKHITIITKKTLPSVLPSWPVTVDPTVNGVSLLKLANVPIVTYFKASSSDFDEAMLVKATFGDGDLQLLQKEIKDYLVKRLKQYQDSQNDIAKVRNISLNQEEITHLNDLFRPSSPETSATIELPFRRLFRNPLLLSQSCKKTLTG